MIESGTTAAKVKYGDSTAVPPSIEAGFTQATCTPAVAVCPELRLIPCPGPKPESAAR